MSGWLQGPYPFFTTNSSDSLNQIIKKEVEWKEMLIERLKSIIDDQVVKLGKLS